MFFAAIYFIFSLMMLILFIPVIPFQLLLLKKNLPQLKNPSGRKDGLVPGIEPGVELLVLGDSTVAGLGVSEMQDSLPKQIATALELYSKRRITWTAMAKTGLCSDGLLDLIDNARNLSEVTMIVFVVGVNDAVGFIPFWKYRRHILRAIRKLESLSVNADLIFAGIPPLERFPAFYLPLSFAMGLWSRALDASVRSFARKYERVYFFNTPVPKPRHYSIDGFHPGRRGYAQWGEYLGREITIRLKLRISKNK